MVKKLLLILGLITLSLICQAQTFSPKVVTNGLKTDTTSLKTPTLRSTVDVSVPMTVRTPALQLTFTRVEKIDGDWKLTTPIIVGYSYIFSYANGVIHQDSSITVENHFFFGGGVNFGIVPDLNGTLVSSVPVGAILGYSKYGIFGGIDALTGKPLFGISVNLLNFPLLQSLTRFNIKQ